MLHDQTFTTSNGHVTNIRAMLMTSGDYAEYVIRRFPYELNDLTDIKIIYPSLVVEIYHMRMPIMANTARCQVLNALVALWPNKSESEVAVVEFRSIQKAYNAEPDIKQCKRILINLMASQWNVHFKGKELIVC